MKRGGGCGDCPESDQNYGSVIIGVLELMPITDITK